MLVLLASVSIIFLSKRKGDLFSRPFMNFTDEEFETLKNRYLQKLRFTKSKFLKGSRNTERAAEAFGFGFLMTTEMERDEFSQEVIESF